MHDHGDPGGIYIPIPKLLADLEDRLTERLERVEMKVDAAITTSGREQDQLERRTAALEGWKVYQEDIGQRLGVVETLVRDTHGRLSLHEGLVSHVGTQAAISGISERINKMAEREEARHEQQMLALAELRTALKVAWGAVSAAVFVILGLAFALIQANQIRLVP